MKNENLRSFGAHINLIQGSSNFTGDILVSIRKFLEVGAKVSQLFQHKGHPKPPHLQLPRCNFRTWQ